MDTTLLKRVSLGLKSSSLEESRQWFERAKRVLAGGISSSARATTTGPALHPTYISRGSGSRIWDADGNEFIDYLLSYGSAILGHANTGLNKALASQLERGTMFGTCNTVEVQLAEQICQMVPCADLVRFANSGSEAICGAIRAARGFTGKNKILKFEGHYHGWVDILAVSTRPSSQEAGPLTEPRRQINSKGITPGVIEDVLICPWNEPGIFSEFLKTHKNEIAAVIAEPIVANNACIMPADGYLEFLQEQCIRNNIVLIFDEIVTGFRVAKGGAQELFGVQCDIAVLSKALGGGMPISAFAGKKQIMDLVADNRVRHGGTYNGNPICAASALHTLKELEKRDTLKHIEQTGEILKEAILRSARDYGVDCVLQGKGSMFQVVFTDRERLLRHYRDLFDADMARYSVFRHSLLENGVHINNSGMACWFVSAVHNSDDVEATVSAIEEAMKTAARK